MLLLVHQRKQLLLLPMGLRSRAPLQPPPLLLWALLRWHKPLLLLPSLLVRPRAQQAQASLCQQQVLQVPPGLRCCPPHAPPQVHHQQRQQQQQQLKL